MTAFRLGKPNVLFSEGNCNKYSERMEDENDAITGAQKGCVKQNKNMYDEHRGVINNGLNSNGDNMTEEFYNQKIMYM